MNKSVLSVLAGSLLLTAASCSSDEPNTSYVGEGTTFTVELPDSFTRVLNEDPTDELGNGLDARNLFYAIYIVDQDTPVMQNFDENSSNYVPGSDTSQAITFEANSLSVTFSRNLLEHTDYEIVLWAQSGSTMGSPYSYNLTTKELSVDYSSLPSTGQSRDAFYASRSFTNVSGRAVSANLYRPFAQINIGAFDTSDYKANKGVSDNSDLKFGMTITDVSNVINLSTGVVSGEAASVTTTLTPLAANLQYRFPAGNDYDMLATTLILAPKSNSALCDVTLNAAIGEEEGSAHKTYNNVPVQGNFRTNIYGNLLTNPTDFTVTKEPTWTTSDYYIIYGHEAVDLGLPSGVKWATCNIGADKPTSYGKYYAWGETETKTNYSSSNSLWYNKTIEELRDAGVIDSNGNLTSAYDAATINWGGTWRMPTWNEIKELLNSDNCNTSWVTLNYVKGLRVTSKTNGKSIFLPAAGYRTGDERYNHGERGHYWSSTAFNDDDNSYNLDFGQYTSSTTGTGYYRYFGLSVRPVTE